MTSDAQRDNPSKALHVVPCIATYKRPEGLRALLQSLSRLDLAGLDARLTLVVVDNAPEEPASDKLGDLNLLSDWPVIYLKEPRRGIVAARNRSLAGIPADADYIAFLDDDETVSEIWLREMLATVQQPKTTAVQGPVEPNYAAPPPGWIDELGIFKFGPFEQNAELPAAATNNSMIDAGFVREHGLKFDMRFNTSGGEDEEFYRRVRRAGGTIRAAANAVVWDQVPRQRMTFRWVARRAFRTGNTLGRISLLTKTGRTLRFAKGVGALGWGTVMCLLLGLGSKKRLILGAKEVFRGAGMLSAFVGFSFQEYSKSAVAIDRNAVNQHE